MVQPVRISEYIGTGEKPCNRVARGIGGIFATV
jgi:hypothetical protein